MLEIGLIDAHPVMRIGLYVLLSEHYPHAHYTSGPGLTEFGQINTGHNFDLIIAGISENAKEDRLITVTKCKKLFPSAAIVIYDYDFQQDLVFSYFTAGAKGYLLKQHQEIQLLACIETILKGERYLAPELKQNFVQRNILQKDGPGAGAQGLTPYEFQIALYLSQGKNVATIAMDTNSKSSAVNAARRQILKKLKVSTIQQLRKALSLESR
jgi:two-component system response regulator NreC